MQTSKQIDSQIIILINKREHTAAKTPAWYAIQGKINKLKIEYQKAKQFEFLAQ